MDVMELGAIGEMVGGVAVLATLGYLAVQVRSAARDQRVMAMRQATREMASLNDSVGDTEDKAEVWIRGITAFETLTTTERLRFSLANGHVFRTMEQVFYSEQDGNIDREIAQGFMNQLRDIAAYPGIQAWWATRQHWYGEQFQTYVGRMIAEGERPSMYGEGESGAS